MIQLEFHSFRHLFAGVSARLRRRKSAKRSAIDYTIRLSAALRCYNLTHAIHDVLCAVAKLEVEQGYATIPGTCHQLSCTYQCVMQHFLKNPELFVMESGPVPRRYHLSPEGIRLLHRIKTRISKYE